MQVVIADFAFRLTEIYADNLQQLLTEDEIAQQPKSILAEDTWIVG
ncbi:MAG: hypothetical protein HWD59_12605 [Coxiellaceae bacterium]|nr:MAG: hypothetical protein HWD59_12605 [Coxiellaceae bacterium]